jgi:hypothetical protein
MLYDNEWDEDTNRHYVWLYNIIFVFIRTPVQYLEKRYEIYFDDELTVEILLQLTLYIFQKVLNTYNSLSHTIAKIYGSVCFGIAFKYLSDLNNRCKIILFIREVVETDISIIKINKIEREILDILDYKIPLMLSDIELSNNMSSIINEVISLFE